MKILISALSLTIVFLTGCMPKLFPFPSGEVSVEGNVIYSGGRPFAELRYFEVFDANIGTGLHSETIRGRGLVIYYYHNDKEVWIHPKKRLSIYRDGTEYTKIEDMKRVWDEFERDHKTNQSQLKWAHIYIGGKPWEKEDAIRSVIYDVKIADDGKSVSYSTQGIIIDSSRKYFIEYGVSQ
jgi:hypothetical protein